MDKYKFGNYLCNLRIKKGYSQSNLAYLLGISDKAVSKWENGRSKPSIAILTKLADIYKMSVDDILKGEHINVDYEFKVPISKKEFENKINSFLYKKYGDNVPLEIYSVFLQEKEMLLANNYYIYVDLFSTISEYCNQNNIIFENETILGSMLIFNLLGISNCNPLKPHYYCPKCKKVIFVSDVKDSFDLKEKHCECGEKFIADGHNININVYKHNINNILFDMFGAPKEKFSSILNQVLSYFENAEVTVFNNKENEELNIFINLDMHNTFDITDKRNIDIEKYRKFRFSNSEPNDSYIAYLNKCHWVKITSDYLVDMIDYFNSISNTNYKDIEYLCLEVKNMFIKNYNKYWSNDLVDFDIYRTLFNNDMSYYDLLRIIGFNCCCYNNEVYTTFNKDNFDLLFTCREEVYDYLVDKYTEFDGSYISQKLMDLIRKGNKCFKHDTLLYSALDDNEKTKINNIEYLSYKYLIVLFLRRTLIVFWCELNHKELIKDNS